MGQAPSTPRPDSANGAAVGAFLRSPSPCPSARNRVRTPRHGRANGRVERTRNRFASTTRARNPMKVGLCTIAYQELPLEEALDRAAALQFDGVELWGKPPHLAAGAGEAEGRAIGQAMRE